MSWDELYKLNSDFINEPLNFNNYINDISTFKENSYVLDRSNENLFMQLVTRSLTMYGHAAIHEVVYNRLDDGECDAMIHLHARLGQALNGFYKTDSYPEGPIDEVLKAITAESYNALEPKIRKAINRYINEKTDGEEACCWLAGLFPDVAGLSEHTSIQSVLEDKEYFDSIFFERKMEQIDGEYQVVTTELNTTLRYILCNAFSAIAFADSMDPEVYKVFVRECATSTVTSLALIENVMLWEKETEFFADEEICAIIAENKEAVWGIAASPEAFHAFLSSTTMLDAIANSEVGFQAVVDGFELAGKLGPILERLKTHADGIDSEIAQVTEDFDIINGVLKMKEAIDGCKSSVDYLLTKVDAFVGNMDSVWGNREFVIQMVSCKTSLNILNSSPLGGTIRGKIISAYGLTPTPINYSNRYFSGTVMITSAVYSSGSNQNYLDSFGTFNFTSDTYELHGSHGFSAARYEIPDGIYYNATLSWSPAVHGASTYGYVGGNVYILN